MHFIKGEVRFADVCNKQFFPVFPINNISVFFNTEVLLLFV